MSIEEIVSRKVEEYLTRYILPEELRRLKQYARDENYNLYIRNRHQIVETIERAREAYNQAIRALNMSNQALQNLNAIEQRIRYLFSSVDSLNKAVSSIKARLDKAERNVSELEMRTKSLLDAYRSLSIKISNLDTLTKAIQSRVNLISSELEKAKSQIQDLQRFSDALHKAYLNLKAKTDSLSKSLNELWEKAKDLDYHIAKAREQIDAIISKLKETTIEQWTREIGSRIFAFAQKIDEARSKIVQIWSSAKVKISTHVQNILNARSRLEGHVKKLQNKFAQVVATFGYAIVDYSKLDGKSGYDEAGNKGEGIIRELADILWCLGQCFYNLNSLVEEHKFEVCVLGSCVGLSIPVPRPDRLFDAVSWINTLINSPGRRLFEKLRNCGNFFNGIGETIEYISAELSYMMTESQAIVNEIHTAIQETMNVLIEMFGGTPLDVQKLEIPSAIAKVKAPAIKAPSVYSAKKFPRIVGKGKILKQKFMRGGRLLEVEMDGMKITSY